MEECNIDIKDIPILPKCPVMPPWEHFNPSFEMNYSQWSKSENENVVAIDAKKILSEKYQYDLKIFTDGSVASSGMTGFGFYIPALNIKKSYHIGTGISIFTAELCAILMSLIDMNESKYLFYQVVICVDSKSVLQSLESWNSKTRSDLIYEIKFQVHLLQSKGINVTFFWVPSHVGIYGNEIADKLAKKGAEKTDASVRTLELKLSRSELCSKISQHFKKSTSKDSQESYMPYNCERSIAKIIFKMRLNAWSTKYSKDVRCICSEDQHITIMHILFNCPMMKQSYKDNGIDIDKYSETNHKNLLYHENMIAYATAINKSRLGRLL